MTEPNNPAPAGGAGDQAANGGDPNKVTDPKNPDAGNGTGGEGGDGKMMVDPKSGEWIPVAKFNEINKELKKFKDAEAKAAEAKLLEDKKYEELIANKDKEISDYKSKYENSIKFAAFAEEASKAGVVSASDAYKLADLSDVEIDENGTVKGIAEKIAKLKEEKPYLFNGATGPVGGPSNPGGNGQGGGEKTSNNKPVYKESETKDPKFFNEHKDDIGPAYLEGRVLLGQ